MHATSPGTARSTRRPGSRVLMFVVLVAVLALAGCTGAAREPAARSAPDAAASVAGDADAQLPPPPPHPTDDPGSQQSALDTATAAVTAFARPDVSAEQWWAELAPMLTPTAAEAYAGTDPAEVPARAVTGPAVLGPSPTSYLATVVVPTDAGEYAVLLSREGAGAPWLVERITPVEPTGPLDPGTGSPAGAQPPADAAAETPAGTL